MRFVLIKKKRTSCQRSANTKDLGDSGVPDLVGSSRLDYGRGHGLEIDPGKISRVTRVDPSKQRQLETDHRDPVHLVGC